MTFMSFKYTKHRNAKVISLFELFSAIIHAKKARLTHHSGVQFIMMGISDTLIKWYIQKM